MKVHMLRVCAVLIAALASAFAQNEKRNEIGLLLGGIIPAEHTTVTVPRTTISPDASLTFQATYARRITHGQGTALYFEIPFVATPSTEVRTAVGAVPGNYASLFVTPGIRVQFASGSTIAPWAALGGGYGRFDESETRRDALPNTGARGTNTGVLQFGGGVDLNPGLRILVPVAFRGEVRDFYSGRPQFNIATSSDRQHNVVVSGGIVLKF